jgi:hypothetical protein
MITCDQFPDSLLDISNRHGDCKLQTTDSGLVFQGDVTMARRYRTATPDFLRNVATKLDPAAPVEPVSSPENWDQVAPKDRLETRPEGNLPTVLDPASRRARGWPVDPK